MKFEELNIIPPILRALKEEGYKVPSPIQEQAIPAALEGRDVLGCAQTGTGKTAAFAIPVLQRFAASTSKNRTRPIRALILTPTRELALQISDSFKAYGRYLGLSTTVIFGGVPQGPQVAKLRSGVDILVATPGRLNDLIGQGIIKLSSVEVLILDEADRMLDMGFIHDVRKVIALLPQKRQTLFFSATMPQDIMSLCNEILTDPVRVAVTPVASTVDAIRQKIYFVDKANKGRLLINLLRTQDIPSALVFTFTKHGADRVVRILEKANISSQAIHGNKSQNARQRALSDFKSGAVRVLVATDIAARGIDIDELSHVFNYDLPNIPETYVHRIGRTGRAGLGGTSVTFCCEQEIDMLREILQLTGKEIEIIKEHPFPMQEATPPDNMEEMLRRRVQGKKGRMTQTQAPLRPAFYKPSDTPRPRRAQSANRPQTGVKPQQPGVKQQTNAPKSAPPKAAAAYGAAQKPPIRTPAPSNKPAAAKPAYSGQTQRPLSTAGSVIRNKSSRAKAGAKQREAFFRASPQQERIVTLPQKRKSGPAHHS